MRFQAIVGLIAVLSSVVGSIAPAQVVQLPSVGNFSYSGAAWVPDAGTVGLAGNSYARSGSVNSGWGPYGSRASGSMYGTSAISTSVQIIDLQALDDAILAAKPQNSTASSNPGNRSAASVSSRSVVGGFSAQGVAPNVDPGKWQRVLAGGHPTMPANAQMAESDIRFYLKMGQDAEAANRVMSARVYYRMAAEAMTPEMKDRYQRNLVERSEAEKAAAELVKSDRKRF